MPAAVSPAAFARRAAGMPIVALDGATMGTRWSVRIVSPGTAAEWRAEIAPVLDGVIAQMSQWEAESDLSRFNRGAIGTWHALPADFAHVLDAGLAVAAASDGAFDPTLGLLVDRWGFGAAGRRTTPPESTPAAATGWRAIERDGARARRTAPVALDFSGIAKGFALDAVARRLRARGADDFLVEIGGELLGAGVKPDGQPWWVDLETPPGAPVAPLRVALHELSVATSGDYRRFFEQDGRRYAHTLDPRTGRPSESGVASATVLHASCMLADAWATALTVLGADAGIALAEREGLAARLVLHGGPQRERLSPALQAMLD